MTGLERVQALHRRTEDWTWQDVTFHICHECLTPWPCHTAIAWGEPAPGQQTLTLTEETP